MRTILVSADGGLQWYRGACEGKPYIEMELPVPAPVTIDVLPPDGITVRVPRRLYEYNGRTRDYQIYREVAK